MNTPIASAPDGAWPHSDAPMPVPNTSMLPPDADAPAPAVRQPDQGLSGAEATLQAKAARLRATGEAWAAGLRGTVRGNPLTWVAGALALGALLGRLRR